MCHKYNITITLYNFKNVLENVKHQIIKSISIKQKNRKFYKTLLFLIILI